MPALLDEPCPSPPGTEWVQPVNNEDELPNPVPAESAPQVPSVPARRVLLLEDDESFRLIIKEVLHEHGYEVCEAQSGLEGIQEVMAGDFSIVLCDMQMPALAGDIFYQAVERDRPKLCERFIFMTGHRGDAAVDEVLSEASGRVLRKPFQLDQMLELMAAVERGDIPARTIADGPPPVEAAAVALPAKEKRILLLEDDSDLREVLKQFLGEAGYIVREARSGVEGMREVLAGDFDVILCDMMMPGLPGDLFYRGVQRASPQLCERFIFMTGHRDDARNNAFIERIGGRTLVKPFPLDELIVAVVTLGMPGEMLRAPPRTPEVAVPLPPPSGTGLPPPPRREPETSLPVQKTRVNERPGGIVVPPEVVVPPTARPASVTPVKPGVTIASSGESVRDWVRIWLNVGTALVMGSVLSVAGLQYYRVAGRSQAVSQELKSLDTSLQGTFESLQTARVSGEAAGKFIQRAQQVMARSTQLRWSAALKSLAARTPAKFELQDVEIRENSATGDGWSIRILVRGAGSRRDAIVFAADVQDILEDALPCAVNCRADDIRETAPTSEEPDGRVDFTVAGVVLANKKNSTFTPRPPAP